jgi:hypothetical protein
MADALRHLTRLGVYKVPMRVSRKFLEIFSINKLSIISNLEAIVSVGYVIPGKLA